jgi:hypothetical protein
MLSPAWISVVTSRNETENRVGLVSHLLTPLGWVGQSCWVHEDVAFLRADVERFCGGLVGLAPAVRLRTLAELRVVLDEVTSASLAAAMASARGEGLGLRRIAGFAGVSHEQVRRTLVADGEA